MKFDTLLTTKEYLHIGFLVLIFICFAIGVDFNSEPLVARSTLVIFVIGGLYYFQLESHMSMYPMLGIEKKGTNYGIIGPFGMILVAVWLALVDFKTPDSISKFTGLILIFTLLNALAINRELNERAEKIIVTESVVTVHKIILWLFLAIIYFVATRYFLINGAWEWNFDIYDFFRVAF
tara:strand:+ start:50 stop:586 length:537 start_codon:yes stop_codon:yes gene_type:complete